MIIAMAGKGGVGKSTIASQIIRKLTSEGIVLAVDADPNSNLGDKLGLKTFGTVGALRNQIVENPDLVPAGISKQDYIVGRIREIVAEGEHVDLLSMGWSQGEGCYCFINGILRECFHDLIPKYRNVVIDNEAGMEHMSRKTLPKADVLMLVSDPTVTGIKTAARLKALADDVGMEAGKTILIVNNAPEGNLDPLKKAAVAHGFDEPFFIPRDPYIMGAAMEGETLDVPRDTPFGKALSQLMDEIRK